MRKKAISIEPFAVARSYYELMMNPGEARIAEEMSRYAFLASYFTPRLFGSGRLPSSQRDLPMS